MIKQLASKDLEDYLKKNPNGYCPDLSTGIVFSEKDKDLLNNDSLLLGKHILILDSQTYCPYCDKLKAVSYTHLTLPTILLV